MELIWRLSLQPLLDEYLSGIDNAKPVGGKLQWTLGSLEPNRLQPRADFDETGLEGLKQRVES